MKRKRARWGLAVTLKEGRTYRTALRFDPDTREQAEHVGREGIRCGELSAFEIIDRQAERRAARRRDQGPELPGL